MKPKGKISNIKVKHQCFNTLLCFCGFSMCIFDQGSQTSQQFMAKPIICKKTSLLLNKGEIYVLLQTRFVFELFLFQYDFNLYFSF